ncbi:flagellar hook-associated protein 3 [Burkholderia sp. WAC0059]|uniref:flagellar hook-associated protein FlgL n=1 Tax=Burkholderia sp. WAC0059 TaxID=2066022 RepID=UPI000C7F0941|nr:flagellar hook-associated protein FlgL [Burkholderia sp. WAC0059]PLZ00668.1 flagellar hook-associated protein 3 [Burkholderia sp. WAC0059]
MRIATSEIYTSTVQTMNNQEAQLAQLEDEISSGQALTTPASNPVAAAQAVQLSATYSTLSQYSTNQTDALTSLQLEDSTLGSVTTELQSFNSLLESANSGTLNDTDRAALAQQLEGVRNQLLSLANTTDGTGSYLFAGYDANTQPFTNSASGVGVTYSGDEGERTMQISDTTQIAVTDPGSNVFMAVSAGATPVASGSSANTGTGTIGAVTVSNPAAVPNDANYSITFSDTTGTLTYGVTDESTTPPTQLSTAQTYTAGQPITLGSGMSVTISGTPASGDAFSVQSANLSTAGNGTGTDVFAAMDAVIAALQSPVSGNDAAAANLTNVIATATTQISNELTNVSTIQASVGGREDQVEATQTLTSSTSTQTQTNLSGLVNTNLTSTISEYEQVETALTASQKTFAETSSLSLFQYINP